MKAIVRMPGKLERLDKSIKVFQLCIMRRYINF